MKVWFVFLSSLIKLSLRPCSLGPEAQAGSPQHCGITRQQHHCQPEVKKKILGLMSERLECECPGLDERKKI